MRNKKKLKQSFNKLQRQLVKGALSIIGISLIIIFIFGNHGVIELYQLSKKRQQIQEEIALLRQQKIDLSKFSAIILTSRNAVDHFFRIAEEMRYPIPNALKYFCMSEWYLIKTTGVSTCVLDARKVVWFEIMFAKS